MTRDRDLLTLLVPFKNRSSYVRRFMEYANQAPHPYRVLFADGSADGATADFLLDPSAYPNVSYRYIRYPFDADLGHFFAKVADAITHVETPFVAVISDDDFCFRDSLAAGLEFLRAHEDYVAAVGTLIDFVIMGDQQAGADAFVYGSFGVTGKIYRAHTYDQNTAVERIRAYLTTEVNTTLWQAVCRTDILSRAWRTLARLSPRDYRFADQVLIQLLLADGKAWGELPLYMLHQANPSGGGMGATMLQQAPTWLDWMRHGDWLGDFRNLVAAVGDGVAAYDGLSLLQGRKAVEELFYLGCGRILVQDFHPTFLPANNMLSTEEAVALMRGRSEFEPILHFLRRPAVAG